MAAKGTRLNRKDQNAGLAVTDEITSSELNVATLSSLLDDLRKSIAVDFKASFSSLETKLDCMQETLSDHAQKISALENNANMQDERISVLETSCVSLSANNAKLLTKVADLESRSRRNNIRLLGLPESIEGGQPTSFFAGLLMEVFGEGVLGSLPDCDMAHRAFIAKSSPGQRPRPVIIRLLRYQQKVTIIREARARRGRLQYRGTSIAIYEDYTPEVMEQRFKYREVMSDLYKLGLKPALLFPARLSINAKEGDLLHVYRNCGNSLPLNMNTVDVAVSVDPSDLPGDYFTQQPVQQTEQQQEVVQELEYQISLLNTEKQSLAEQIKKLQSDIQALQRNVSSETTTVVKSTPSKQDPQCDKPPLDNGQYLDIRGVTETDSPLDVNATKTSTTTTTTTDGTESTTTAPQPHSKLKSQSQQSKTAVLFDQPNRNMQSSKERERITLEEQRKTIQAQRLHFLLSTKQGPFRPALEVQQQRHRPLEPSLRVATSITALEEAREELKRQERRTRVIDQT
ncbi:unnamed protein product [Leuciscus chuanchicus]